jgi:hypothetical protein
MHKFSTREHKAFADFCKAHALNFATVAAYNAAIEAYYYD